MTKADAKRRLCFFLYNLLETGGEPEWMAELEGSADYRRLMEAWEELAEEMRRRSGKDR